MNEVEREQNHLYIISYDLDSRSEDSEKSKRLISFLRKYHAISVTKSTWLLCTPSACWTVFIALEKTLDGEGDPLNLSHWFFGSSDEDRLFIAEITGNVYYQNLICEDSDRNQISFSELLDHVDTVQDGFEDC